MRNISKKFLTLLLLTVLFISPLFLTACSGAGDNEDDGSSEAGNAVTVNGVEYTVVDKTAGKTMSGNDDEVTAAEGQWVVVEVNYKNTADENRSITYQKMSFDFDGESYQPDSVAGMAIFTEEEFLIFRDLEAGEEGSFKLIAKLPDEAAESDELKLSFTSYEDDSQTDAVTLAQ